MAIQKKLAAGETLTDEEINFLNEVDLIQATSRDNPYFPDAEYERKRLSMDPRRFNMIYGGNFERMEGLVYDCFRDETHIVPCETLPEGTIYLAGVDWGYTNPASIIVIGVAPDGFVYLVSEYYKTQQTISQMVEAAHRLKMAYGIERFYCDPSSPANITEFNKARLTAIPANNDIRSGVDALYELMNADKFRVFEGRAPNFLDEVTSYHYPNDQDIHADKDIKERLPVKQYDHALDSCRYVVYALKLTGMKKRNMKVPGTSDRDMRMHVTDHLLLKNLQEEWDW